MEQQSITTPTPADLHALLGDFAAMLPGWDLSRPTSELASALKDRLSHQPTTQTRKCRGKSMSRRRGQTPKIEKHGRFYTVRGRMKRAKKSVYIGASRSRQLTATIPAGLTNPNENEKLARPSVRSTTTVRQ